MFEMKIVYFITVKQRWKYKKGNYITFDSIFFLCLGWVEKEKNAIECDIFILFYVSNDD
jgi:hypothetical protein